MKGGSGLKAVLRYRLRPPPLASSAAPLIAATSSQSFRAVGSFAIFPPPPPKGERGLWANSGLSAVCLLRRPNKRCGRRANKIFLEKVLTNYTLCVNIIIVGDGQKRRDRVFHTVRWVWSKYPLLAVCRVGT